MSKKNIIQLPTTPSGGYPGELEALKEEHKKLYETFLPTLSSYQDMAKRALELQISIFKLRLAQAFPEARQESRSLVTTITAREMLPNMEKLIAEIERQGIKIEQITYDPRTFSFLLFSNGN